MVKLVNTLVLETKRCRFESFPRQMDFTNFIKKKELNFNFFYSPSELTAINAYSRNVFLVKNRISRANTAQNELGFKKLITLIQYFTEQKIKITFLAPRNETPFVVKKLKTSFRNRNVCLLTNWKYGQLTNKVITLSRTRLQEKKHSGVYIILSPEKNIQALQEVNDTGSPVFGISTANQRIKGLILYNHVNLIGINNLSRIFILLDYLISKY